MREEAIAYSKVNKVYSINVGGKIGQIYAKNETRPPSQEYT